MKHLPLFEVEDSVSYYLCLAEKEDVIITQHGKLVGILFGYHSGDDWKQILN